jgi:hypothetical protein
VEQVAALHISAMDRLWALDRMMSARQRLVVLTRFYGSPELAGIRCRESSCPVYAYQSERFSYSTALDRRMLHIIRAYARGE